VARDTGAGFERRIKQQICGGPADLPPDYASHVGLAHPHEVSGSALSVAGWEEMFVDKQPHPSCSRNGPDLGNVRPNSLLT